MEFHISRSIRDRLDVDGLLFSYTGNVVFANVTECRKLAHQLQTLRESQGEQEPAVNAGALFAMGLIDELNHTLVARYRKEIDPSLNSAAIRWFASLVEPQKLEKLLLTFVEQFPNADIYQGKITAAEWLRGKTEDLTNREAALEELMLLWLANINPAFAPFRELFEDTTLQRQTVYKNVVSAFPDYLVTRPPVPEIGTLFDALRAPMLASPDSLTGQLDFIREQWSKYLGEDLKRVLLAIDILREEDLAIWLRFHPPGPDWHRHGAPGWAGGFAGDEYVGFDQDFVVGADGVRRPRYAEGYQAPLNEYEAFSADQAWMPNVVLIAKSTYVWLEQLSKKYGRHIHRLDQIPEEELQILADRGITGLWLIGLWERSIASRTIKRLRGHGDAVASAYSLKQYNIAEDLGGYHAYETLRDRAAACGIRLASDMVPNHMGIDSEWVVDHPDWFIHRWESPFPVYSFNGPDLSTDSRVEIKIEDHYYDQSDAAVVFRLRHHRDGTTRYIYHGNDGTTFAWNDTAQLDYSKAYVREQVIQTILHVARQFPIIRFDAAMVLAKRHVQRLWFPLPGAGGSIPSRAENSLSQEEFDALMPHEFWREVVDRVAAEVPGTLLLAEAFWLLEGYFVRTLGMHRVYNSAFMNMLRDEENAKYRSYLKKTIEFDSDILKRYVNFMSNPDERTAIDQFGSGDKYFGVCTLLATLPGLPMFGHGQIEGFTERYGMEFKRARMEEYANEGLVARHQHDIAPLLKNRRIFAESTHFVLYDFWTDSGTVDENVFAYSNRLGDQRSIILYNNRYGSTRGTIHKSVGFTDKTSGTMRQANLIESLALPDDDTVILAYRDRSSGLEYLRRNSELRHSGLRFDLRGYQYAVLLDWRILNFSADYPWDSLCDALHGEGVYSVDEALYKLRLRPMHDALRHTITADNIHVFTEIAAELSSRNSGKTQFAETAPQTSVVPKQEPTKIPDPEESGIEPLPTFSSIERRLQPFISSSQSFFEKVLKCIPHESKELLHTLSVSSGEQTGSANIPESFSETCRTLTAAALLLPRLEQGFSTVWPRAVRSMLPGNEPWVSPEKTWAPVLAWIILRSFPAHQTYSELFDKLQLRSALAEAFSSVGMEGEQVWQAAARVRLLLWQADRPMLAKADTEEFWADPDVRWLTGVNTSSGKTYVNKELFEEFLAWQQLPLLIEAAKQWRSGPSGIDISAIEEGVEKSCIAMTKAGYDLDLYLKLRHDEADNKTKTPDDTPTIALK